MTVNSRLQNVKSSTMNQLKSMPEYLKLIRKNKAEKHWEWSNQVPDNYTRIFYENYSKI